MLLTCFSPEWLPSPFWPSWPPPWGLGGESCPSLAEGYHDGRCPCFKRHTEMFLKAETEARRAASLGSSEQGSLTRHPGWGGQQALSAEPLWTLERPGGLSASLLMQHLWAFSQLLGQSLSKDLKKLVFYFLQIKSNSNKQAFGSRRQLSAKRYKVPS